MAEYRAVRHICHHFNLSGVYVDDDLEIGLFFVYLAESLDAEELGDYKAVVLQGGKKAAKKWKWATPDRAGTRPIGTKKKDVRTTMLNFAQALTKKPVQQSGTVSEYAKHTGSKRVYQDEDGNLYDANMNLIESDAGLVFIPTEGKPH